MTAYSKSETSIQEPGTALAPASKPPSQGPAAPLLPHESEADFEVLTTELANELTGPLLGFGRKLAKEAASSRLHIGRLRQALNASAWCELAPRPTATVVDYESLSRKGRSRDPIDIAEIEARLKSWQSRPAPPVPPKLELLEQALAPLLDSETRRFEELVALRYFLLHAAQRLLEMEQNAHLRSKRGIRPPSDYVDDQNKLTRQAWRIIGEPPLVRGDLRVEYETAIVDLMTILGNSKVTNLYSAIDIVNYTWQILRFLELREKRLQAAFEAMMRKLTGDRPEREDDIDPEIALAITLHEHLPMLINFDRIIDRICHCRKRTIDNAIKRNAVRLRTIWVPTSGMKLIR